MSSIENKIYIKDLNVGDLILDPIDGAIFVFEKNERKTFGIFYRTKTIFLNII